MASGEQAGNNYVIVVNSVQAWWTLDGSVCSITNLNEIVF